MTNHALLGGLTPSAFLTRHWHRKARLIRGAIPRFTGILSLSALQRLAERDDVESRLVLREGRAWQLEHGPFFPRRWRTLPPTNWTLLVQGVNYFVPAAAVLLEKFRFLSYARLDDVMVSYAAPGGGVGPHLDSYDVFLLQGPGRRRWRIGSRIGPASAPRLRSDTPLKILARFSPTDSWVLDAGDMLYLPPSIAHEGVALDACTTYSIGFRAPTAFELGAQWLTYVEEHPLAHRLGGVKRYGDAGVTATRTPAAIPTAMLDYALATIQRLAATRTDVAGALGCHLTTPKSHIVFDPPAQPLSARAFRLAATKRGLRLDLRTSMLYDRINVYMNGEPHTVPRPARPAIELLANDRTLAGGDLSVTAQPLLPVLYDWYRAGYLYLDDHDPCPRPSGPRAQPTSDSKRD
ncbi:MAG: cupin domain-containing protein [Burkholderiales bacterium]